MPFWVVGETSVSASATASSTADSAALLKDIRDDGQVTREWLRRVRDGVELHASEATGTPLPFEEDSNE